MDSQTLIESVQGVGKYYSRKLKKLKVLTIEDFIYHFPFRYDDYSKVEKAITVNTDQKVTIKGIIWSIKNIRTRFGKFLTLATVSDESAIVEVVWFNQSYLTKTLIPGTPVLLSGKVQKDGTKTKMLSPTYEIIRSSQRSMTDSHLATLHTARLVPVYPETEGLSSKWLRTKIAGILPGYLKSQKDYLPSELISRQHLIKLDDALSNIHFPASILKLESAQKRLAFDELLLIQLSSKIRKKNWLKKKRAPVIIIDEAQTKRLTSALPFELTDAQKNATQEILGDLQNETAANRLLEGDVGSGKTVVAAIAAYHTFLNGFDTLIAAPTEILAFQHQKTLSQILSKEGIRVGIWTGSKKDSGDITCGTHALLETFKAIKQVGLVVVDEQHRFGVAQRAKLFTNHAGNLTPHLLTMTATPIPRTLALTIYGDLDLSTLNQMPKGRQQIATFVVPNKKRSDTYKFIEKQVNEGRQAFIITPFVAPSETMVSVRSAIAEYEKLKNRFSKELKLGLLHGRLKSKEKEVVINKFKEGSIHILVSTPVVEVGIDVPNASVMMIESADRFGLAQLHQLRGRVGRGKHKSFCFIFTDSTSQNTSTRLKSLEKVHVGFELAEIDLKMRGSGEIFGLSQSGFTNLKIADITDAQLVTITQQEADKLIVNDSYLKYDGLVNKLKIFNVDFVEPN